MAAAVNACTGLPVAGTRLLAEAQQLPRQPVPSRRPLEVTRRREGAIGRRHAAASATCCRCTPASGQAIGTAPTMSDGSEVGRLVEGPADSMATPVTGMRCGDVGLTVYCGLVRGRE